MPEKSLSEWLTLKSFWYVVVCFSVPDAHKKKCRGCDVRPRRNGSRADHSYLSSDRRYLNEAVDAWGKTAIFLSPRFQMHFRATEDVLWRDNSFIIGKRSLLLLSCEKRILAANEGSSGQLIFLIKYGWNVWVEEVGVIDSIARSHKIEQWAWS